MPPALLESVARKNPADLHGEYPAYFVKVGWDTTVIDERPTNIALLLLANNGGGIDRLGSALMPYINSTCHLLPHVEL